MSVCRAVLFSCSEAVCRCRARIWACWPSDWLLSCFSCVCTACLSASRVAFWGREGRGGREGEREREVDGEGEEGIEGGESKRGRGRIGKGRDVKGAGKGTMASM